MDGKEILKKITESAENVEMPDALNPYQIKARLNSARKKKIRAYKTVAVAACMCLCFGIGSYAYSTNRDIGSGNAPGGYHRQQGNKGAGQGIQASGTYTDDGQDLDGKAAGTDVAGEGEKDSDKKGQAEAPLKKIGKMFTLASDYGDVYEVLVKGSQYMERKYAMEDSVSTATGSSAGTPVKEESAAIDDMAQAGSHDYSTTNLQVDGVDESDIVKTDGKYIYAVQDTCIHILDVQGRVPKEAAVLEPAFFNEETDAIKEIYVAGGMLTLIVQSEKFSQKEQEDAYYFDADPVTKVLSYSLSDPKNPVYADKTQQDGFYQDSRKIGDILYLFTNKSMYMPGAQPLDSTARDAAIAEWIPKVDDVPISAGCIYLPKAGNEGLAISSIELSGKHKVLDTKLLVNQHADIYVTHRSVYLYYTDYMNDTEKTRIAKFILGKDGLIQAKAAATVKGRVEDTFAINERDGYLQVLTSVTSSDPWENRVYVLDGDMQTAGKIVGLAQGERIYAARFIGDTGYFVTYRNTDPLFTVDFSDPKEPKVIGELKVTGFSDYLHFWGRNKLLGIGQETDPQSGQVIGVKLSMFDISDPTGVKEEAKLVLKGVDYSEAMYDYKSVLADRDKNLIALTTQSWGNGEDGYQGHYRVYSYQGGKFASKLERPLVPAKNSQYDAGKWRSVYVGDTLYLVSQKKVFAFDMAAGFREIGKVKFKE